MISKNIHWIYNCIVSLRIWTCYKGNGINDNMENSYFDSARCANQGLYICFIQFPSVVSWYNVNRAVSAGGRSASFNLIECASIRESETRSSQLSKVIKMIIRFHAGYIEQPQSSCQRQNKAAYVKPSPLEAREEN